MNTSLVNKEFRIVYQQKNTDKRVRFLIDAGRLKDYIGEENASKCIEKAIKSKTDKTQFEFRKMGTVIFYVK